MAWSFVRDWLPALAALPIVASNSSSPAAAGSTLVALVGLKPGTAGTAPMVTVTDNLGGTWHQAESDGVPVFGGDAASSTNYYIFARLDAGGVSSVEVASSDGAPTGAVISLSEWAGGPAGGVPTWLAVSANRPSGETWDPLTVDAPAGALVVGGGSMGVTNRTITLNAGDYTALRNDKTSGVHAVSAYHVADATGATGPQWSIASGGAASLVAITAAITGATGPQPLAVDVGADQTINTDEGATVTAAVTGGSGQRTFAWTVESGPSGMAGGFVEPESASTIFDPGDVTGTYVLRCTVTDGAGSAYDELTLSVLRTLTFMPLVGVTAPGWTVTGAADAQAALGDSSDATYATMENPTDAPIEGTTPPLMVPDQPLVVRARPQRREGTTGSAVAHLYTDATLRATSPTVDLPVDVLDWVDLTFPLDDLTAITEADWEAGVRVVVAFTAA